MKIALETAGKSPVNSGIVTTGLQPAVVTAVVVGVTLSYASSGSVAQHILLGSVCGPTDGKQAGPVFSGVPGGAQDLRDGTLPKFHVRLAKSQ